jgi:hypothetical protein
MSPGGPFVARGVHRYPFVDLVSQFKTLYENVQIWYHASEL